MTIALASEQSEEVRIILRKILASERDVQPLKAWVFGSRVTGRLRPFSDLDILITEPPEMRWQQRADMKDALEASNLPFCVDVVEVTRLSATMVSRVMAEQKMLL